MSTKSRQVIFGSRIAGAKIRAESARERAKHAIREADRAEAEAWSIRMEGYGGPAQPSPTIAQCLNGGYLDHIIVPESISFEIDGHRVSRTIRKPMGENAALKSFTWGWFSQ